MYQNEILLGISLSGLYYTMSLTILTYNTRPVIEQIRSLTILSGVTLGVLCLYHLIVYPFNVSTNIEWGVLQCSFILTCLLILAIMDINYNFTFKKPILSSILGGFTLFNIGLGFTCYLIYVFEYINTLLTF